MVTQNAEEAFDLDYNLILQKDKQGLIDNPQRIKDIVRGAFDRVLDFNQGIDSGFVNDSNMKKLAEVNIYP